MIRSIRAMRRGALVACVVMLTACGAKPGADDVRQVLQQNVPDTLRETAVVDQAQTETSSDGDSITVKFKAQLKTTQALYSPAEVQTVAGSAGADLKLFGDVDRTIRSLSPRLQQDFESEILKQRQLPTFIEQTTPAAAMSDWYGSYHTKKVVDRWVVSDFKTEVQPSFKGMPRKAFPADAVTTDTASSWFADRKRDQQAFLQRVAATQKLQETEERLAAAQTAAEQEKETRERAVRHMPLNVGTRPAALGGTIVLRFQVLRPMTVTLDVARGLQRFSRELQLAPGRTSEFGHVEGWGFRSGDQVTLTNPAFDPMSFTVP
jgi:hypothetical protein